MTITVLSGSESKAGTYYDYGPITGATVLAPSTVQEYWVEAGTLGSGDVSGDANSWLASNSLAHVQAHPAPYHSFHSWSGDVEAGTETNNPLNVLVDSPKNIAAIFVASTTESGTPYLWYVERGVLADFEEVDTQKGYGDFTGREKYIMGADRLDDDADYFRSIGLAIEENVLKANISHSKTNRLYRIDRATALYPSDWMFLTNSPGTGGPLIIELPASPDASRFLRGAVELP